MDGTRTLSIFISFFILLAGSVSQYQQYGGYYPPMPPGSPSYYPPVTGNYPSYSSPIRPPQTCLIPNYIPDYYVLIQADQLSGKWYFYRNSYGFRTANGVVKYRFISHNDYDVVLYKPSSGLWMTVNWRDLADNSTCKFAMGIGKATINGLLQGFLWVDGQTYPAEVVYQTLYLDPSALHVNYQCGKVNAITGYCQEPHFLISTRTPWNKLDQNMLNHLDRVIDAVLAPFCRTGPSLPRQAQGVTLANCTEAPLKGHVRNVVQHAASVAASKAGAVPADARHLRQPLNRACSR